MAIDRILRSTPNLLRHFLVPVVVCGLLANACMGLHATHPVAGVVAGTKIKMGVDSELAAYFVGSYLAENRHQPNLDRRIDALYRDNSGHRLPGREELKRIADEFSVDFAAIYFREIELQIGFSIGTSGVATVLE